MGGNRSKRRPNKRAASEQDNAAGVKARRQAAFQKNKKYLWPLLIHLLVFYAVYAYLVETRFYGVVFWTYFALTAAFSLAFVIYNRGFSRQRITPDMLPDTMTPEEKEAFAAEAKERLEKSKWMITVIVPLLLTFLIDILNMYLFAPLIKALGL